MIFVLSAIGLLLVFAVIFFLNEVRSLRRQLRSVADRLLELEQRLGSHPADLPLASSKLQAWWFHRDWEAIIGTNWLNRLGTLVLVIGVALFLAYSLTQLGPAGKIVIGFTIGFSMLIGGMVLHKETRYRGFGLSLIGGGWAAVYFTCYAMYGLEGARVIEDPVIGTLLLLSVSALMLIHALQNRSETATSLGFLITFVSLNLTALTAFSVFATSILAVSLVLLAHGFVWGRLATAGVILTYATFALRHDVSVLGRAGILNGQTVLWTYWLLFEAFDLLRLRATRSLQRPGRWLFALNVTGFAGASLFHEWSMKSTDWAVLFAAIAAACWGSSLLRAQLLQEGSYKVSDGILFGGYEGSATAASVFTAAASVESFSGIWISAALLLEAEFLLVCGLLLRRPFLTALGGAVFTLPVIRLVLIEAPGSGRWILASAAAAAFLVHRWYGKLSPAYPYAAALLAASILFQEFSRQWITVALGVSAAVFLGAGLLFSDVATRLAGLLIFVVCIGKLFLYDLRELPTLSRILSFVILGVMLLLASWVYTRYRDKLGKIL